MSRTMDSRIKHWLQVISTFEWQLAEFPDMPAVTKARLTRVVAEYKQNVFEALEAIA